MKFCEECGAQLEDDMKFCDECGTPVTDYEEVQTTSVQNDVVTKQAETSQQETAEKPPARESTGGSKKKVALLAGIVGVLVLVAVLLVIILPGKAGKENDINHENENRETVNAGTNYPEDEKDGEETQVPEVTKAVADDQGEDSDADAYPLLEEFISVVCSYSDPPLLEEDAWKEYFKGEYDSWASGEGYSNIVVGEDGHLINTDDYSYGDPLTGNKMFRDATYGVYTIVSKVGNLEYGFRVKKEKSIYAVELVLVNENGQFLNSLEYTRDGVFFDEGNEASGVINENTGEWVSISFVPYEDGECWFTFVDYFNNIPTVLVDEILPAECVSYRTFDNYQEYYNFLWN